MTRIAFAVAALAAVVALAPSASAIYIMTPLQLTLDSDHANVGDEVEIAIGPTPDWDGASYAGRTLVVRYYYDPDEGAEGQTAPEGGSTRTDFREIGRVTLDENSKGSIRWIVPAELDDHNAFLSVANETDSEDGLAFTHLPVGDAMPLMLSFMSGEKGQAGEPEPAAPVDGAPSDTQADAKSNVPAPGVVAIVAGLAAAAALVARRR